MLTAIGVEADRVIIRSMTKIYVIPIHVLEKCKAPNLFNNTWKMWGGLFQK